MVLCFLVTYPKKGNIVKRILTSKGYGLIFQDYNEILVFEIPKKDLDKIKKIKYIKKLFPITLIIKSDISILLKVLKIFKDDGIFHVKVKLRDGIGSSRDLKTKILEIMAPNIDKNNFNKYLIVQGSRDRIFISILDKKEYFERRIENFSLKDYIKNKYKLDNFKIIETTLDNLKDILSNSYRNKYIVLVVELPNEKPKTISEIITIIESYNYKIKYIKKIFFLPNNKRVVILKNL